MGYKRSIIKGDIFGRLTVIERVSSITDHAVWLCLCSCGTKKQIKQCYLFGGNTKSCGCLALETRKSMHIKHGDAGNKRITKEYNTYMHIKARCQNPNGKYYHRYGGRGISVCERWLNSYEDFLHDMGRAPSVKHSIDRINNDGNYEPGNCRWATMKEQQNNRSNNRNGKKRIRKRPIRNSI